MKHFRVHNAAACGCKLDDDNTMTHLRDEVTCEGCKEEMWKYEFRSRIIDFDAVSSCCPYFASDTEVNNGYGCTHPKQEETDYDDKLEKEHGKCYCWSCPLGCEADDEDIGNPHVDWDGCCSEGEVGESEYLNIFFNNENEPIAHYDALNLIHSYDRYINRYNADWQKWEDASPLNIKLTKPCIECDSLDSLTVSLVCIGGRSEYSVFCSNCGTRTVPAVSVDEGYLSKVATAALIHMWNDDALELEDVECGDDVAPYSEEAFAAAIEQMVCLGKELLVKYVSGFFAPSQYEDEFQRRKLEDLCMNEIDATANVIKIFTGREISYQWLSGADGSFKHGFGLFEILPDAPQEDIPVGVSKTKYSRYSTELVPEGRIDWSAARKEGKIVKIFELIFDRSANPCYVGGYTEQFKK